MKLAYTPPVAWGASASRSSFAQPVWFVESAAFSQRAWITSPNSRVAVAIRGLRFRHSPDRASQMRNFDVAPRRLQSGSVIHKDADRLGLEVVEIVPAPVVVKTVAPARVE